LVELDKSNIELKLFSSELSLEDSKVFKELMVLYPWCSSFKVAYLKSLKTKNDLRFSSELEKYAVELNSRSVIYDLTKNFNHQASEQGSVEHQTSEKLESVLPEEDIDTSKQELQKTTENKLDKLIASNELKLSISKKISAPSIVGMLSKNANLDASFRFKPIRRAAVIAVPDLEAPGIKANT